MVVKMMYNARENDFSDGTGLVFDCQSLEMGVQNYKEDNSKLEELGDYGDVVFSKGPVIIRITAGPLPEKNQLFVGPVSVREVMEALVSFYSTAVSESEYVALESWGYGFDERDSVREQFKKYGDLQHGYWLEGFKTAEECETDRFEITYSKKERVLGLSNYKKFDIKWGS
jgi:hypothetical protein